MILLFPFKLKSYLYKKCIAIVIMLAIHKIKILTNPSKFIAHKTCSINVLKKTTMESPPLQEMPYFPYFSSPNPIKDHIQN